MYDDGNQEFEDQYGHGQLNDDSNEEVAQDINLDEVEDDEDDQKEESMFDSEGELKTGKQDPTDLPKVDGAALKKQMEMKSKK